MSISNQQLIQALTTLEEQLNIIKQALSERGIAQDDGVVGVFDGEFMVEADGKKHQIPPNYASKSMLVAGDTIKMLEDPNGGQTKYKQIAKVERMKTEGVLVKKDGKYEVLAEEGSFKVLSAAIKHYDGQVGDAVKIQYPKQHPKGGWAAVVKVIRAENESSAPSADALPLNPILVDHQQQSAPATEETQREVEPVMEAAPVAAESSSPKPKTTRSTKASPKPERSRSSSDKKKEAAPRKSKASDRAEAASQPVAAQEAFDSPSEPEFDEDDLV